MISKRETFRRYLLFVISLFFVALGVNLAVQAQLGITAISTLPYVVSLALSKISLGVWMFILNLLFVILQIILLGKKFQLIQLLQIPLSIVFGWFIDLSSGLLVFLVPSSMLQQFLLMLLGAVVLAFGVSLSVIANVIMNSGEALVKVIADKTNKEFGYVKVAFDLTLLFLSMLAAFCLMGQVVGIGIGTVIAAVIVGLIVRIFIKRLMFLDKLLTTKTLVSSDNNKFSNSRK